MRARRRASEVGGTVGGITLQLVRSPLPPASVSLSLRYSHFFFFSRSLFLHLPHTHSLSLSLSLSLSPSACLSANCLFQSFIGAAT